MAQIQLRRGTASAWTTANPVLGAGEPGFETDTLKFKIGDGSTAWAGLAYEGGGGSAVATTFAPTGTIAATDVQSAIAELLAETIPLTQKAAASGIASLDGTGDVPVSQLGNATVSDADATTKGKLKLAGDLGGTADLPTVPGLSALATDLQAVESGNVWEDLAEADVLTIDAGIPAWRPPSGGSSGFDRTDQIGNLGPTATTDLGDDNDVLIVGTLNASHVHTIDGNAEGKRAVLRVKQDATGGRTLSISDGVTPSTVAINLDADAVTEILIVCPNGTDIDVMVLGAPGAGADGDGLGLLWGDGTDGAVVLDGTATFAAFASKSGSTYTLTRPIMATTLVVNSGVTLRPAGYRVHATVLIENNGTIDFIGGAGTATGVGAVITPGGNGLYTHGAGGPGKTGVGSLGSAGGAGGATGGAGGAGASGAGFPGQSAPLAGQAWVFKNWLSTITGMIGSMGVTRYFGGGGGGTGGTGDGTNKGGGGGAGGGLILLASPEVTNPGTILATGGAGGTPTTGNCGGGGGGGGVVLVYTRLPWTNGGMAAAAGGAAGAGVGTGAAAAGGNVGTVLNVIVI